MEKKNFDLEEYTRKLVDGGLPEGEARLIAERMGDAAESNLSKDNLSAPQKLANMVGRVKKEKIVAPAAVKPVAKTQLPLWPDLERAMPNHLARSSLFSPIAPGKRKQHDRAEISSREDVKILFTGKQLDMADCDVFMQALYEAHRVPLGEKVFINRGAFLKSIGRSNGSSDYSWLHESLRRLFLGAIEIQTKSYNIGDVSKSERSAEPRSSGLHLINSFDYDPEHETYFLTFEPRILQFFSNREYALIDWGKRRHIAKRVDMAKWLQNYIATHEDGIHRISLKLLKTWMDYESPMNKFVKALTEALAELERLEIIAEVRIENSVRRQKQAVWIKL